MALEKHYRVKDLANLWGFSDNTIIRMFSGEEGVIRLETCSGKRRYTTLSIPESVALRVHERLGHEPLQTQLPARNPLRIVRLRDLNAGMGKKPRHILKLKAGQELANGKGITQPMRSAVGNPASDA
jgi:hypothetical protein